MILDFRTDQEFQGELDRVDEFQRKDGEPLDSISRDFHDAGSTGRSAPVLLRDHRSHNVSLPSCHPAPMCEHATEPYRDEAGCA